MTREGEKEGEREDRLGRTFSCSKQPSHTTPFLQPGSWGFALVFNQWYFSSECPVAVQQRTENITDKGMSTHGNKNLTLAALGGMRCQWKQKFTTHPSKL